MAAGGGLHRGTVSEPIEEGKKEPGRTSGAPYPAADPATHDDSQHRPRRDVPTAPETEEGTDAD